MQISPITVRQPDMRAYLDRLLLRSRLTDDEQQAILDLPFSIHAVPAHQDFVPLGVTTDRACLVWGGVAGRFDQDSEGRRQITAVHLPGDMADLHSVVQPRTTSALQALAPCVILQVRHSHIRALCAQRPAIMEALWRDCMVDAAIFSQWVLNLTLHDAQTRMAHLFCEIAVRSLGTEPGYTFSFPFPVTQASFANLLGITVVHVNRTLQTLRGKDLVDLSRGVVTIFDWDELRKTGNFSDEYLLRERDPRPPLGALTGIVRPV